MSAPITKFRDVLPETLDALARGGIANSQAALSPTARTFHQRLLSAFLSDGGPPSREQLRTFATDLELDLDSTLVVLAEADLVHTDPAGTAITVAYPFSGRSTPHRVRVETGPVLAAMCAVDALGIPLMAHAAATITSTDPTTGQAIRIDAGAGCWHWQPTSTVVLLAAAACDGSIASACMSTAFHANADSAAAQLAVQRGWAGRVLDQHEALAIAANEFGPLLVVRTTPYGPAVSRPSR